MKPWDPLVVDPNKLVVGDKLLAALLPDQPEEGARRMAQDLVNLTPHPLRFYRPDTPDQISNVTDGLIATLGPSGQVARLGEIDLGTTGSACWETHTDGVQSVPVELIEYCSVYGLPPVQPGVRYVVPLVTALAILARAGKTESRDDLLVPYSQVRNTEGTVVGCRFLAHPC